MRSETGQQQLTLTRRHTAPTTCEIVEIMSRDLSPPQSDIGSGSEAGSDVSALAEDIVNRVMGTRREARDQREGEIGGERERGGEGERGGVQSEKTASDKTGKTSKSVRFTLEASGSEAGGERGGAEGRGGEVMSEQQVPTVCDSGEAVEEGQSKVTVCSNGTRKIVSSDGKSVTLEFVNGDTKHIQEDGTVVC